VLLDGEAVVETGLLRDPARPPCGAAYPPRVRVGDPGEDREQGRLARAVRTEHGEQLAAGDLEAHLAQGGPLAVGLRESLHPEHGCGPAPARPRRLLAHRAKASGLAETAGPLRSATRCASSS